MNARESLAELLQEKGIGAPAQAQADQAAPQPESSPATPRQKRKMQRARVEGRLAMAQRRGEKRRVALDEATKRIEVLEAENRLLASRLKELEEKQLQVPAREALDESKQAVPAEVPPSAAPLPQDNAVLLRMLMAKLDQLETRSAEKRTRGQAAHPSELSEPHRAAWDAVQWAIAEKPALAGATDGEVFAFLNGRKDCPFPIPPKPETFRRYLSSARFAFGASKR